MDPKHCIKYPNKYHKITLSYAVMFLEKESIIQTFETLFPHIPLENNVPPPEIKHVSEERNFLRFFCWKGAEKISFRENKKNLLKTILKKNSIFLHIWIKMKCGCPYVIELYGEVEQIEVDWEVVSDILPIIRPHQFIKHLSFKNIYL